MSAFGDSSSQVRYSENSESLSWLVSAGYEDVKSSSDILDLPPNESGGDYQRRLLGRGKLVYTTASDIELTVGAGLTGTDKGSFETAGILAAEANKLSTVNGNIKAAKIFSSETEGYLRWAGRYQDMDRSSVLWIY